MTDDEFVRRLDCAMELIRSLADIACGATNLVLRYGEISNTRHSIRVIQHMAGHPGRAIRQGNGHVSENVRERLKPPERPTLQSAGVRLQTYNIWYVSLDRSAVRYFGATSRMLAESYSRAR